MVFGKIGEIVRAWDAAEVEGVCRLVLRLETVSRLEHFEQVEEADVVQLAFACLRTARRQPAGLQQDACTYRHKSHCSFHADSVEVICDKDCLR